MLKANLSAFFAKHNLLTFNICILGLCFIRAAYYYSIARDLPLSGDEHHYYKNSVAIYQFMIHWWDGGITNDAWPALVSKLVGYGWFMPGMSFILAPAHFFTDSVHGTRLYIYLVNCALMILALNQFYRRFTLKRTAIFAFLLLTFPALIAFNFTFWGESLAGTLLILICIQLYDLQIMINRDAASPEVCDKNMILVFVKLGFLLAAIIYIRQNFILIPAIIIAYIIYVCCMKPTLQKSWRNGAYGTIIIGFICTLCILPWSNALSHKFGDRLIISTSVYLNMLVVFEPAYKRIPKGKIFKIHKELLKESNTRNEPYGVILKEKTHDTISNLTMQSYATKVCENMGSILLQQNIFLDRYAKFTKTLHAEKNYYLKAYNSILWIGSLLCIAFLSSLYYNKLENKNFYVVLIGFFLCLPFQAFISTAHGRYYVAFIALLCFIIAIQIFPQHAKSNENDRR